ncbi:hypothetical protein AB0N73_03585 [Microbacterium sp. NPDC089189]|uniref:hypothetical protein n=1 Tax=Microbacterium sp. NPDC089189 TaxID=3154972 RepID=UPI00343CD365
MSLPAHHRPSWRRAIATGAAAALVLALAPNVAHAADPVAPVDQLAVSVVGDGATTGNNAVPVGILLLDGQGEIDRTVALPTAGAGAQHAVTLGADRDQQGALQQSADHRYVTLGGYDAAPGSGALNDTTAPATPRVVARVDAQGGVDTSTTLGGGYSVRHIRGTATVDGTRYWTGGHGGDSTAPTGGVLTVAVGEATPTAVVAGSNNLNNARVVDVHDGQLYATSDRSGFSGLNAVGTGTPTTSAPLALVAAAPAGASVAHDFAFAGDTLYVGYTEGANQGIAKYARAGQAWNWVATYPGNYWGIEAREAGDDTVIYAVRGAGQGNELVRIVDEGDAAAFTGTLDVLATAAVGTAFRGVAFAPGFEAGTDAAGPILAKPAITWDPRVAGGTGAALAAVLGQGSNPAASGTVIDPAGQEISVTAASSNTAVLADDAISLDVDAVTGAFRLAAAPVAAGSAVITLRAETADGRSGIAQLSYRVAPAFSDAAATGHIGMSDASAAIDAGDGYFFAADDDSNALRLFAATGGEPVAEFDFSDRIEFERPGEAHDFEAVARVGDDVYWIGSTGNTRSGNVRLDRDIVVHTRVSGSGANAALSFVGARHVLRDALVAWDHDDAHGLGADHFGFLAATQPGSSAEGPDSLNIEGAAIAPDGTTLWLGFRSPEVGDDAQALIVPVADIAGVVAGAEPQLGAPTLLDLGGRAIRDMARAESGDYLIVAGSADDTGRFALYGWSGELADAPVAAQGTLGLDGWAGSYEGIAGVGSLADGESVRLLLDSGTVDIYGDGTAAQDLSAPEHKLFPSQVVALSFGAHFVAKEIGLTSDRLRVDVPATVSLSGFAPEETITLSLTSDPVTLAEVTADADGRATVRITVPAAVAPGAHTLHASAASGAASRAVTVLPALVDEAPVAGPGADAPSGGLAATGGTDLTALVLAALLALGLGGGLMVRRRIRSR